MAGEDTDGVCLAAFSGWLAAAGAFHSHFVSSYSPEIGGRIILGASSDSVALLPCGVSVSVIMFE